MPNASDFRPLSAVLSTVALVIVGAALPPEPSFGATGSFSRATAAPGETIVLSGKALPNSSMSAYFYCNAGCGETHVGAVAADRNGNYSLTFKIPAQAKPGPAYVAAGCDSCGNGWGTYRGVTIAGGAVAAPPVSVPPPAPPKNPKDILLTLTNGGERCFGAIGNACADQVRDRSIPNVDYSKVGIRSDFTVSAAVSVGSILHDNCCRSNRNGLYCTGINWGSTLTDLFSLTDINLAVFNMERAKGGDSIACAKEWRKAVYDTLEKRFWYEKFGPYRDDLKADDTERLVQAREAKLPGRFGVRDSVTTYTGKERGETIRMRAPAGTKLEIYDRAFCASGSFREEGWCAAGALCSGSVELENARQSVRNWENWRNRKLKEAEKFWPVDPRRAAILAEIGVAEADHAARVANVARLEGIFNTRNAHWGICR